MYDDWSIDDILRNLTEDQGVLSVYCVKNNLQLIGFSPDRENNSQRYLRYFFNDGYSEGHNIYELFDNVLRE